MWQSVVQSGSTYHMTMALVVPMHSSLLHKNELDIQQHCRLIQMTQSCLLLSAKATARLGGHLGRLLAHSFAFTYMYATYIHISSHAAGVLW